MLLFSRKPSEVFWVGNVRCWIQEVKRDGRVVLAFEAPKSIPIDRDEVRRKRIEFQEQDPEAAELKW